MEKKEVKYRVFVTRNAELTHDATDLKNDLRDKLVNSKIERRLIPVGKNGSVKDLLGSFAPSSDSEDMDYIYGVMMRLKPAKELKALPENLDQLIELSESDLRELQEIEGKMVCTKIYRFLIKGKYLVTDLPQYQSISAFQNYLAKLLGNNSYKFVPYLKKKELKLKDIEKVIFKDSFNSKFSYNKQNNLSLRSIAQSVVRAISPEVKNLKEIIDENMLSASMVLNFECPRNMNQEDYENKLGTLLAPINDLECISFSLKNGMKLMGSEIIFMHKETLEADIITPLTYIKSMLNLVDNLDKS